MTKWKIWRLWFLHNGKSHGFTQRLRSEAAKPSMICHWTLLKVLVNNDNFWKTMSSKNGNAWTWTPLPDKPYSVTVHLDSLNCDNCERQLWNAACSWNKPRRWARTDVHAANQLLPPFLLPIHFMKWKWEYLNYPLSVSSEIWKSVWVPISKRYLLLSANCEQ